MARRAGAARRCRPECESARHPEGERQPEEDHQARPHQRAVVRIVDVPEHAPSAAEVRCELVPVPWQDQASRQPHCHRAHGDREQGDERGKGPPQPPGHPVARERHERRGARNHRDHHQHRPARGRIDDHAEPRGRDIRRERREGQQPDSLLRQRAGTAGRQATPSPLLAVAAGGPRARSCRLLRYRGAALGYDPVAGAARDGERRLADIRRIRSHDVANPAGEA